jgi:hypothetical protein
MKTTPLSPAAQAAWIAFETVDCDPYLVDPRKAGVAAALRAVADQVVDAHDGFTGHRIHASIFAIAEELEGQP